MFCLSRSLLKYITLQMSQHKQPFNYVIICKYSYERQQIYSIQGLDTLSVK